MSTSVLVVAVLVFLFFWRGQSLVRDGNINHLKNTITLTDNGFEPQTLTVRQGESINFQNRSSGAFWPASDLHPTHDVYPEFDPKVPIEPDSSWSFTFEKAGVWKFHDHLHPTFVGEVIVTDSEGNIPNQRCDGNSKSVGCWQSEIETILQTEGLDAAFQKMADLYASEPLFAQSCHSFAHELGKAAFREFEAKGTAELSDKSTYCGYGFYHGFMETLMFTTGDVEKAREFCKFAGEELQGRTNDAEGACFHGIGHGVVDGNDERAWGDAQKMLNPGIALCEKVAGEFREPFGKMYRCITGAYNALEILSSDPKYKLSGLAKDPFGFCPTQPEEFLEGCYTNMLPALLRVTGGDFRQAAKAVYDIQADTETVRGPVSLSLFHEFIRENLLKPNYNIKEGVELCHELKELSIWCVEGLSGGHMKYGKPEAEYEQGLKFCASPLLNTEEKTRCYGHILPRLRVWYSPAKSREICGKAPEEYRPLCYNV